MDYVGIVGNADLETYKEISKVAELIVFQCVYQPTGVSHGGIAAGLGESAGEFPIISSS